MNRLRRIAVAALLVLPAFAGAQEGRTYAPGPFERLAVAGQVRVELSQGETDSVFVAGDDGVQRSVRLRVAHGRLVVESDDEWKFWSRTVPQLKVQMRQVKELAISGASDIVAPRPIRTDALRVSISGHGLVRLADLTAEQLRFDISGAGDGELGGSVAELQLRVSGKGKFAADRLRAARADVAISGIGNAEIWTTDELRVAVSGIGNVKYWGQPKVVQRASSGIANVTAQGDKR